MVYSLLTCSGFSTLTGYIAGGSCIKARLGLVILFFLIAIIRKWGGEEMGVDFSFLFAIIGGLLPYFIVVTLFGSFKIGLLIGIVGALVGGYGAGVFLGGSDDGGYE